MNLGGVNLWGLDSIPNRSSIPKRFPIQNGFWIQYIRVLISGSTTVRCGLRNCLVNDGMTAEECLYEITDYLYSKRPKSTNCT